MDPTDPVISETFLEWLAKPENSGLPDMESLGTFASDRIRGLLQENACLERRLANCDAKLAKAHMNISNWKEDRRRVKAYETIFAQISGIIGNQETGGDW